LGACSLLLGTIRCFLLIEKEGLDLEGLSLKERKFNFRERLEVKALGGRFCGLKRGRALGRRVHRGSKMRGVGSIYRENTPSLP